MMNKNIFAGSGMKTEFINLIYNELMKRHFLSYSDVLSIYYGRDDSYYDVISCNSEKGYGELKKAFPTVIKALEQSYPGCIEDNGKTGKGRAFKYVGMDDDPLREERKAVVQKSIEDFVLFCKSSAGILPSSWFSSFFEHTQLLLDTQRESQAGLSHVSSSLDQILTNIDLLPLINNAIMNKQVLTFTYQKFDKESYDLIFHPQYIKEYNGRWFVFGEADREPYHAFNVPLDRIVGEISIVDDIEYIPAPQGFYNSFFENIVGVTHVKGNIPEEIIIHTKSEYLHGLIITKPFHHSQKETIPFGNHNGKQFGEIRLFLEPNRELQGKILLYGYGIEVVEPILFREQIKSVLQRQIEQYV